MGTMETLAENIPRLAALAAQGLGWRPRDFWAATPPELMLCLADPAGGRTASVTRADLDRMTDQDRGETGGNG